MHGPEVEDQIKRNEDDRAGLAPPPAALVPHYLKMSSFYNMLLPTMAERIKDRSTSPLFCSHFSILRLQLELLLTRINDLSILDSAILLSLILISPINSP
jgi:hypothetical protein